MTLGQEFEAFAATLADEVRTLRRSSSVLCETNMGAHGHRHRPQRAGRLREKCTATWRRSPASRSTSPTNLIEATQDTQAFVLYSSCMKSLAIKLSKVCNDLRLLSSGPRCGFREINLPAEAARARRSCRAR